MIITLVARVESGRKGIYISLRSRRDVVGGCGDRPPPKAVHRPDAVVFSWTRHIGSHSS